MTSWSIGTERDETVKTAHRSEPHPSLRQTVHWTAEKSGVKKKAKLVLY